MFRLFKAINNFGPKPPKKDPLDPESFFKRANRPTITLATILASEMFRNLDVRGVKSVVEARSNSYEEATSYIFPSFTIKKVTRWWRNVNSIPYHKIEIILTTGDSVNFGCKEKSYLEEAFGRWSELVQKHEQAKREADNQQNAINAIANIMGVQNHE